MLLLSCSDKAEQRTDWDVFNLKGKVSSAKEVSYHAHEEAGKVIKGEKGGKDRYSAHHLVVFNKKGYRTEEYVYEPDNSLFTKQEYIRNNGVQLNEIIQTYGDSSPERIVFEYGDSELASGFSVYEDGRLVYSQLFTYNDRKLIAEQQMNHRNEYNSRRFRYHYDENSNITEIQFWKYNDELDYRVTYAYDSNNNLAEECRYDADGSLLNRWAFTYNLGANDNWVVRYDYQNDTLKYMVEREIEYF